MQAIVTVKLPRNPQHNPQNKKSGKCPITGWTCTDVTGSHHSYIESGQNRAEIWWKAKEKFGHVTRIEVIEEVEKL